MGWKAVKERYVIGHIVHMDGGDLLVGSPYVSEILRISPEGVVTEKATMSPLTGELARYAADVRADPQAFARTLAEPDAFDRSIPVFFHDGPRVLEDACEEFGWPNATHSGSLMWENAFWLVREDAVRHAIASTRRSIEYREESVAEAEQGLAERRARLDEARSNLARLCADHPEIAAEPRPEPGD